MNTVISFLLVSIYLLICKMVTDKPITMDTLMIALVAFLTAMLVLK